MTRKVAIFGGTFDPIHWGHLLIAETAFSQFALDEVIWMPAYQPPHKSGLSEKFEKSQPPLAFEHRLEMVRRSIGDHPAFTASRLEADRAGASFAIDTLLSLQTLYPQAQWYWILGTDAFQKVPHWYRSQEMNSACEWLVAPRSGVEVDEQNAAYTGIRWQRLQIPLIDVSSGLIRQYLHGGRSIRYLVPEPARLYIHDRQLYQSDLDNSNINTH